jgi:hypothetical protein
METGGGRGIQTATAARRFASIEDTSTSLREFFKSSVKAPHLRFPKPTILLLFDLTGFGVRHPRNPR